MANEWHFTLNGQPTDSPVSVVQLKQLAVAGQLQPTDMVWQEGMTGWVPANSIKGLFPPSKLVAPAPPPKKEKDGGKKTGEFPILGGPVPKEPSGGLTEMHPLLVLLFTVLTAGLFGLFYAYHVSALYTARAAVRKTDAAGRTLGRARHPIAVLLLSYLTVGFYFAYWTYRVMQECGVYAGGRDYASRSELTLMLVFPGYAALRRPVPPARPGTERSQGGRRPGVQRAVRGAAVRQPLPVAVDPFPGHALPGRPQSDLVHGPMTALLHVRPCPHPSHRAGRLYRLGCALAGFTLLAVWDPVAHPGPKLCPLRWAVGLPCPSCGMTRGLAMCERGRFLEALWYNPLAVPLFLLALALCVLWAYEFGTNRSVEVVLRPAWKKGSWIAVLVALFASWAYLLAFRREDVFAASWLGQLLHLWWR